jgi:hypothetical protein
MNSEKYKSLLNITNNNIEKFESSLNNYNWDYLIDRNSDINSIYIKFICVNPPLVMHTIDLRNY